MRLPRLAAVLVVPVALGLAVGLAAPARADAPPVAAVAAMPVAAATAAVAQGPRARIRMLHRELRAATVVARLKLTADQKAKLRDVLGKARAERDQAKQDPEVKSAEENLEHLLGRAIAEVHQSGKVSTDTQAALAAARVKMKAAGRKVGQALKGTLKGLKGLLTPEQRRMVAQAARMRRAEGRRGGRGPAARKLRRRGLAHFLLSDAFYAELGR